MKLTRFFSILYFHGEKIKTLKKHFQVSVRQELGRETWPKQGFGGQPGRREASSRDRHATYLLEEQFDVETPTVNFLSIHSGIDYHPIF